MTFRLKSYTSRELGATYENRLATLESGSHYRDLSPVMVVPANGWTLGDNNVAYQGGNAVRYGKDSKTTGSVPCAFDFILPSDFDQSYIHFIFYWWIYDGSNPDQIDYTLTIYYLRDGAVQTLGETQSNQIATLFDEWITRTSLELTPATYNPSDLIRCLLYLEDDNNQKYTWVFGAILKVGVNTRD